MATPTPNANEHDGYWQELAKEVKIMRILNNGNHHGEPCNDDVEAAADDDERTHMRTMALIQKAEATLRTYSPSTRPKDQRQRTKRRQRLPPKTSLFDFERRRRKKRSAGYEADIEIGAEDVAVAVAKDTMHDAGIFPIARSSHRRKKNRYESTKQINPSPTNLVTNHSQPISNQDQGFVNASTTATRMRSPSSEQIAADNLSVVTAATMATSISASPCTIPDPTCQLPFFQVNSGSTSPFTLSQNTLTMSQAIVLSQHAHIVVDARSPFLVKHANAAFCRLLGNNSDDAGSSVLGEPLLTNQEGKEGRLQKLFLEAGKIILFPIVSEYGGNSHGWEFHHHNAAAPSVAPIGGQGIITHFLIQIVDGNSQQHAMQVVA